MEHEAFAQRSTSQGYRRRFLLEKSALLLPPTKCLALRRCDEKSPEVWWIQKHPPTFLHPCVPVIVLNFGMLTQSLDFVLREAFLHEAISQFLHPFGVEPSAILHESLVPTARQQYGMHAHK